MAKSKVFSLIYKQLVRWFVKIVWPWIVENIWPEIQKQLIDIFVRVVRSAGDAILEWMRQRQSARDEAAQKRATEAEQMARNAQTEAEAEKHRAIAQVWREVAEQFRQENELLKVKLDDALKKSASDFRDEMNSMAIKDIVQEGDTVLQLPGPSDKS